MKEKLLCTILLTFTSGVLDSLEGAWPVKVSDSNIDSQGMYAGKEF